MSTAQPPAGGRAPLPVGAMRTGGERMTATRSGGGRGGGIRGGERRVGEGAGGASGEFGRGICGSEMEADGAEGFRIIADPYADGRGFCHPEAGRADASSGLTPVGPKDLSVIPRRSVWTGSGGLACDGG